MTWTQAYTPLGSLILSALVASLPVVVLLGLLAFTHVKAHFAALAGLAASMLVAIIIYKMPWKLAGMAAVDGMAYGAFPIGWIVVGAIFVYDITVHTGQFEIIKQSIAGLADDRRIQAILIAFCFGSFMEGAAGFGTPVAISAAMLIGLGFRPLPAAGLALIGNTAPVAFGAMGTPIMALANVTNISPVILGAMIGKQLALFGLIIPFWLICAMCGWRQMLEVWPACLTAGFTFGLAQYVVSNVGKYRGPWLVDIVASLVSILSVLVLLKFWQPKTVWRFDHDEQIAPIAIDDQDQSIGPPVDASAFISVAPARTTGRQIAKAWMPWILVSVVVFVWGVPSVKTFLNSHTEVKLAVPVLHRAVFRAPPVVPVKKVEDAFFSFNWLTATGTALLLTGFAAGFLLKLHPVTLLRLFGQTLYRVRWSLLTISAMMAIGYTTRYGGLDATMGLAFASTGRFFPFFSPILGWLGVALTGSDTASNVLFGNLQQITANKLGFSPILAAASNSSGGVMGKMIDAQSIVVAGVATNQRGGEGQILRYVFFHSIVLAILVGVLVMLQAYF